MYRKILRTNVKTNDSRSKTKIKAWSTWLTRKDDSRFEQNKLSFVFCCLVRGKCARLGIERVIRALSHSRRYCSVFVGRYTESLLPGVQRNCKQSNKILGTAGWGVTSQWTDHIPSRYSGSLHLILLVHYAGLIMNRIAQSGVKVASY